MTELATVPSAFVSAALSYELSGLEAGDRVLIHAGAGGVGLAAIQLAQARGGNLCDSERPEAGVSAIAGGGAHIRQPPDGVRRGNRSRSRVAQAWTWC